MLDIMKTIKDKVGDTGAAVLGSLGKKLAVIIVGLILNAIQAKHPDWILPDPQLVKDLVYAFLGCHTLTDVAAILKAGVPPLAKDIAGKLDPKDVLTK